MNEIGQRKLDHLDLCANEDIESRAQTNLLEQVALVHNSLPELAVDEIDLSTSVCGLTLRAPLVITGMTGGVERAANINRALAKAAEVHGVAFGFGSQRPFLKQADRPPGYDVRDVAPTAVVIGNIGAVQAAQLTTAQALELVQAVGANALAIHLNPGQEMIQPEGDRDFRGCVAGIERLVAELEVPVLVKETGCGLGPVALQRLKAAKVCYVDVSGVGGTTWIGVESKRTGGAAAETGRRLWDWGVPTAVATTLAVKAGFEVIGSGGVRSGLHIAKLLALGAGAGGLALPLLRAFTQGGELAVIETVGRLIDEIRTVMLLTGSADLGGLRSAPRVIGRGLQNWLSQLGG